VKKLLKWNWFVQDDPDGDPLIPANDAFDRARDLEEHPERQIRRLVRLPCWMGVHTASQRV